MDQQHFSRHIFLNRARTVILGTILGAAGLAATLSTQAQYEFSYNFTTGPNIENTSGLYTGGNISPWVFNSELDNGSAVNAQMRYRTDERLPNGGTPDVGVTLRSRITGPSAGNGTMIYYGNDISGDPFVMDLSEVGSTFTMTMGYAPNPADSGMRDGGANVADVGNQLMKMGMISAPTGQDHTLGNSPSLFISYREISGVKTDLPNGVLGSTTGYYEVRTTNAASGIEGQLGTGTVTLQAMNTASDYNYYVYETTYTNVGYESGEALFNIVVDIQAYSINRTTFAISTLGTLSSYELLNVDSDLDATELQTMVVALGYTYVDTSKISITGSTYDYFSTNIDVTVIPEPAAFALVGLSMLALVPRRRRRTPAQG